MVKDLAKETGDSLEMDVQLSADVRCPDPGEDWRPSEGSLFPFGGSTEVRQSSAILRTGRGSGSGLPGCMGQLSGEQLSGEEEGMGASVPLSVSKVVSWMGKTAGFDREEWHDQDPLVEVVRDLLKKLESPPKKAGAEDAVSIHTSGDGRKGGCDSESRGLCEATEGTLAW